MSFFKKDNREYRAALLHNDKKKNTFAKLIQESGPKKEGQYIVREPLASMMKTAGGYFLITCFPKSGSTYLRNVIMELLGYDPIVLVYAARRNEQDLYLPAFINGYGRDVIAKSHIRAADHNVGIMNLFSIRPIVLVRNLFDVVVSIYDYIENGDNLWSMCYINEEYYKLDKATKYDMIIDLFLPWYFNFLASWVDVKKKNMIDYLFLTYEELTSHKKETLQKVIDYYNFDMTDSDIENALKNVEKRNNNYNKGVKGRGGTELSGNQKEKIKSYTKYYPWVDFSVIGL